MRSNAKKVMQRLQNRFERVKREAPRVLSNEGQNFFNKQFREQEHDGKKWPEVERRKPGSFAYKYAKPKSLRNNPILVGKARRLKNALNRAAAAGTANVNRIKWLLAGVPYAVFHNDGIGQKKRTIMAASSGLGKALKRKYELLYRAILR